MYGIIVSMSSNPSTEPGTLILNPTITTTTAVEIIENVEKSLSLLSPVVSITAGEIYYLNSINLFGNPHNPYYEYIETTTKSIRVKRPNRFGWSLYKKNRVKNITLKKNNTGIAGLKMLVCGNDNKPFLLSEKEKGSSSSSYYYEESAADGRPNPAILLHTGTVLLCLDAVYGIVDDDYNDNNDRKNNNNKKTKKILLSAKFLINSTPDSNNSNVLSSQQQYASVKAPVLNPWIYGPNSFNNDILGKYQGERKVGKVIWLDFLRFYRGNTEKVSNSSSTHNDKSSSFGLYSYNNNMNQLGSYLTVLNESTVANHEEVVRKRNQLIQLQQEENRNYIKNLAAMSKGLPNYIPFTVPAPVKEIDITLTVVKGRQEKKEEKEE